MRGVLSALRYWRELQSSSELGLLGSLYLHEAIGIMLLKCHPAVQLDGIVSAWLQWKRSELPVLRDDHLGCLGVFGVFWGSPRGFLNPGSDPY